MLTVCPSCRHTFQTDSCAESKGLHYPEENKIMCSLPIVVSTTVQLPGIDNHTINLNTTAHINSSVAKKIKVPLSKQERIRNTLSGGNVIYVNNNFHLKNGTKIISDEKENKSSDDTSADKKLFNRKIPQDSSVSPTSPLSFIIPHASASYAPEFDPLLKKTTSQIFISSERDLQRLSASLNYLKLSNWYHGNLSWKESISLLMPSPVGTFLVRNSSDPQFLYSLSVQTKCGPTSIRIKYSNGEFRLDAERAVLKYMPRFPCVMKLIQYYIESTLDEPLNCFQDEMQSQVWIDCIGQIYSQIVLDKPLYAKGKFPSLKHLSRLAINRHYKEPNQICSLPHFLISYIQQYPFKY